MEGLGSLWGYQESVEELKNMLLQTTYELDTVKKEAKENMRRSDENMKQLLYFLKLACQERDEARDQLHKLLNKHVPTDISCVYPPTLEPESPLYPALRGNSSITVSDSISDTYNHQSYGSSPVDSLLDIVSSPDVPNLNMADSTTNFGLPCHTFVQEYNCQDLMSIIPPPMPDIDLSSAVIDNLVKGKPLPDKGKLLQAVMEAGPLLKTLLVSGSLPQWRNPPPLQPFQMPPFSMNACDTETTCLKPLSNLTHTFQTSFTDIPHGSSQMYLGGSGTYMNNKGLLLSPGVGRDLLQNRIMYGKRQRCQ